MNTHKLRRVLAGAGWRLVRITRRGHYLYKTPAGGLQTVNLHGQRCIDDYARSYAERDIRREQKVPDTSQEQEQTADRTAEKDNRL